MTDNQAPVAAPETAPATRATALAHYVRAEGLRIPPRLLSTLTSRLLEGNTGALRALAERQRELSRQNGEIRDRLLARPCLRNL